MPLREILDGPENTLSKLSKIFSAWSRLDLANGYNSVLPRDLNDILLFGKTDNIS